MAIGLEKIRSAAESFASLHAGHHAVPVIRPVTAQGDPKNGSGRRTDFAERTDAASYSIRFISGEEPARDVRASRTSSGIVVREYTLVSAGSVRAVIVRVFPSFVSSKS